MTGASDAVLVPLQPNGQKPPLFCLHPLDGDVMVFAALVRHIDPDQPVYGLRAPDPLVYPDAFQRLQSLAAHYVDAIRDIQPSGPYCLAGFSFGAGLALEMAQQLRAVGNDVSLLAILDNPPPHSGYKKLRSGATSRPSAVICQACGAGCAS